MINTNEEQIYSYSTVQHLINEMESNGTERVHLNLNVKMILNTSEVRLTLDELKSIHPNKLIGDVLKNDDQLVNIDMYDNYRVVETPSIQYISYR